MQSDTQPVARLLEDFPYQMLSPEKPSGRCGAAGAAKDGRDTRRKGGREEQVFPIDATLLPHLSCLLQPYESLPHMLSLT